MDNFFNDSTSTEDEGGTGVRGPWNEDGIEFVQAPSQPIAAATAQEVTREIQEVFRKGPARATKPTRSKNGRGH